MAGKTASDPHDAAGVDKLIQRLGPLSKPIPAAAPAATEFRARPRSRLRPIAPPMKAGLAWGCIGLGVALDIALPYWPYGRAYGWGLVFYLCAVAMVFVAGVWGLLISWKSRLGFAHVVSLVTFLWAIALTAEVVLPRIGYAKVAAMWWYS